MIQFVEQEKERNLLVFSAPLTLIAVRKRPSLQPVLPLNYSIEHIVHIHYHLHLVFQVSVFWVTRTSKSCSNAFKLST